MGRDDGAVEVGAVLADEEEDDVGDLLGFTDPAAGVERAEDVREAARVSGSQIYHYFDSKQALIRAVITRQADAEPVPGKPMMGALDSFDALRAWADAAVERQEEVADGSECTLTSLAAELSGTDEDSRADLSHGFLRWQGLLHDSLRAMQQRGDLSAGADLDELALGLLAALQGGKVLSRTMGSTKPLRAALNAALSYVRTYVTA
ncbi:TetR/AcrR family transcriptional regulator [Actinoplanes sp. N902-109]|uniref:TetR/AcrR family transcriptional regulator n=1 Tax=Actinoplanes sp. (strain N902-109) TaxID=649831 RepID=UPI0003295B3F|nr:TetR family transcriptional regulator C-terminal domain-containing protein [Actinoplanes sp. N902-109]AGL19046.1 TetR family transcriptional regulator [Actinoplanes sp. N902-109]